ncbi:hypothetical protein PMAYCL1PPCAC_23784 [Pristionchus mayeri]|uniref:BSD domain-containing protein n=1 Tax=Pristionchus mayeri TaxID=1317129 RepID=A0AAN5D0Z8_9BILA|nr:hypothetical protein PMAYCL1PPCAC_23784 [Pristionchus mayeri]
MDFLSGLRAKTMHLADYVKELKTEGDGQEEKAPTFGATLMSYAREGANQMKKAMDNGMLGEMERHRQEHENRVESEKVGGGKLPWEDLPNESLAMKQILSLSLDTHNLLNDPPGEAEFTQTEMDRMAVSLIERDTNLAKARFELVPKALSEERFWKNYFYRVSLIRARMMQCSESEKKDGTSDDVYHDETTQDVHQTTTNENTSSPCDLVFDSFEAEILAGLEKEEEYEVVDGDRKEIDDLLH